MSENDSDRILSKPQFTLIDVSKTVDKVYEDGLQPITQETGILLGRAGKLVNAVLGKLFINKVMNWAQIESRFVPKVAQQLLDVPEAHITQPKISIAGPIIEAVRFCDDEPELQDMFAKLLSTAIDERTAHLAHPSYAHAIRQLTSDDARVVNILCWGPHRSLIADISTIETRNGVSRCVLDRCSHIATMLGVHGEYGLVIDNLVRLGLAEWWLDPHISEFDPLQWLEVEPFKKVEDRKSDDSQHDYVIGGLVSTALGRRFRSACVANHSDILCSQE